MSLILDALKKSEADRQQQSAPDISAVSVAASKPATPRWLLMLVGLLAVNLVVLTVVLLKPSQVTQPAAVASEPVRVVEPPQASQPPQGPGVAEPPAASQPVQRPRVSAPNEVSTPAIRRDTPAHQPEKEPAPAAAKAEPLIQREAPPVRQIELTFNELRASGILDLPDLNVDIHVYSEKPSDRFVFINMHQYRENETLAEGPLLLEITTEGVILDYAGAAFLLPRD